MKEQQATILLLEDDVSLSLLLSEELELDGYSVTRAGTVNEACRLLAEETPDLVVSDLRLPDGDGLELLKAAQADGRSLPFIIITAFGTVDQAVDALKAGADDFLTKPLSTDHLRLKIRRLLTQADLTRQLQQFLAHKGEDQSLGLIGEHESMVRLRSEIRQIARSEAAVLICGESGTGKELVARAIHQASGRSSGSFVAVNCAGIPGELMESEFFGHEAGAFTGARQARKGLFAEAHGGTLLLDEIGEMPLALQAKLLRVLQEGMVKPVGADQEEPVDVRILAATHVDLLKAVHEGSFREDLYYRLETLSLRIPPLRERGDDVDLLAMHFLREIARKHQRGFLKLSEVSSRTLMDYPFPGNVRELGSAIERAVTFCEGDTIQPDHLPERIRKRRVGSVNPEAARSAGNISEWPTLEHLQQDYVREVMQAVSGNKRRAAQILGINRRTLYRWLAADQAADKTSDESHSEGTDAGELKGGL
ncbi:MULTISPECIES: sigma-54 dependent transcriptional regulator [unclassified Marinobacter]|uniref:sigma-54-dependent transcriptional regulator n=1 Tax=unclassified Marinobacter TaxID=83889 RepID=UPI0026E3006C|nr:MULTISPECIES: sigma-54 dependent transcriptional regulator [unclassified Marinobacter]MDO6442638.1 sigma-54 dependent transcriptional regulator [Marinobacter sp. 2_MG-2023]MDO6823145.1 sigma-54 dependent transcriptional regulator [Marinobacter sp. 1_MG-2023]